MLWLLNVVWIYLWFNGNGVRAQDQCPYLGTAADMQDGTNNFVVDWFTGQLLFTYAMDQCTSLSLLPTGKAYKYMCDRNGTDKWMVTKTEYSETDCTGTATVKDIFFEGETMEGYPGYFMCDGTNSYVKVEVSFSPTCSSSQVVFGGLSGCSMNRPLLTRFYCDPEKAYVQLFLNSSYLPNDTTPAYEHCDSRLFCNRWKFNATCGLVSNILGNNVYGKLDDCMTGTTTSTTVMNSASVHFVGLSMIVALVVSLFWNY